MRKLLVAFSLVFVIADSSAAETAEEIVAAALIEAEWTNYTTDGTPPGGCRVAPFTYLAAKTKEGWKFLSSHPGPCKAPEPF